MMPTAIENPVKSDVTHFKRKVYTRNDIEALIAKGQHVFIHDKKVIRADVWLPFHPGGPLAVKHMIGRDATDEVNAYVSRSAIF